MGLRKPPNPTVVEADSVKLLPTHLLTRVEIAGEAAEVSLRNRPNPKETEDVIDSKGVIELLRLPEPFLPPAVLSAAHFFPVVNGKVPVLTEVTEHVRRRPGSELLDKDLPVGPNVHAVLVHKYREVSLESHAEIVRRDGDALHLLLQP